MRHGVDVDMQFGVLAPKLGKPGEQALLREKRQDVEVQAQRGVGAADLFDHVTQFVENRRQLFVQRPARFGQAESVVVAVEQRAADGMLQCLDAARQSRHRQAEFDCGRLDRAVAGDLEKGLHAADGGKAWHIGCR